PRRTARGGTGASPGGIPPLVRAFCQGPRRQEVDYSSQRRPGSGRLGLPAGGPETDRVEGIEVAGIDEKRPVGSLPPSKPPTGPAPPRRPVCAPAAMSLHSIADRERKHEAL